MSDAPTRLRRVVLERMAKRLGPHGERVFIRLMEEAAISRLELAVELGMPPVAVVPDILNTRELRDALNKDGMRRFVGSVVKFALEQRGWAVERTGVRVSDPKSPFSTGAIYGRPPPPTTSDDLLDAMISGLTLAQRESLVARIRALPIAGC